MSYPRRLFRITSIALFTTTVLLAGCKPAAEQQQGQTAAAMAQEVDIITLKAQPVTLHTQLSGRTSAYRVAEVRPQVGGIVLKRLYKEGSDVKAGQVLYQIDPASYQASLASAKATYEKYVATEKTARIKAERYKSLLKNRGVSQQDYDDAEATWQEAVADVASSKAAIDTAKINLNYTKVTAPISGRIGKSSVTEGALVTAEQTTALTTIQQLDPIYVDVSQSSGDMLRLKKALDSGQLEKVDEKTAKVQLQFDDGSQYADSGKLQFSDVTVDEGTGTVTMRAIFPNKNQDLLPGMFVRAELSEASQNDALLIPQFAVSRDPKGNATAWIVNDKGQAEQVAFDTSRTVGNYWLVKNGLKAGDKIIVNGIQKIRAGMPVSAKNVDENSLTAASANQ